MDKRFSMIKNGIVENIIVWDSINQFSPQGYELVEIVDGVYCDIGFTYINGEFFPPEQIEEEASDE
jgi:hypothetical protein